MDQAKANSIKPDKQAIKLEEVVIKHLLLSLKKD